VDDLPHVDTHARRIVASPQEVWSALITVLRGTMRSGGRLIPILGAEPGVASAAFSGQVGDTLPGFRVAEAELGRRLVLCGRHRFSSYRLTFVLDGEELRAETHAAFPGFAGKLYRAAVIGSGGHRVLVRRLLKQVARVVAYSPAHTRTTSTSSPA